MNPYLLEFELKERRKEMLAAANHQRLVNLFNAHQKSKIDAFFLALADLLIGQGEKLRRRHGHSSVAGNSLCR